MLTQERLKELLHYDPETGEFTRLKVVKGGGKNGTGAGTKAGTIGDAGYLRWQSGGKLYLLHRLAFLYMTGEFPEHDVDHINHDRTDNRWVNLRQATRAENLGNMQLSDRNTSGVTGVSWHKASAKWWVRFSVNKRSTDFGRFNTLEEAKVHAFWVRLLHGIHPNHGSAI